MGCNILQGLWRSDKIFFCQMVPFYKFQLWVVMGQNFLTRVGLGPVSFLWFWFGFGKFP